jgi:hypothetical protein
VVQGEELAALIVNAALATVTSLNQQKCRIDTECLTNVLSSQIGNVFSWPY